ncbi:unnamed protein product, partial [Ectocarpus sp. 4 AP-2014]
CVSVTARVHVCACVCTAAVATGACETTLLIVCVRVSRLLPLYQLVLLLMPFIPQPSDVCSVTLGTSDVRSVAIGPTLASRDAPFVPSVDDGTATFSDVVQHPPGYAVAPALRTTVSHASSDL